MKLAKTIVAKRTITATVAAGLGVVAITLLSGCVTVTTTSSDSVTKDFCSSLSEGKVSDSKKHLTSSVIEANPTLFDGNKHSCKVGKTSKDGAISLTIDGASWEAMVSADTGSGFTFGSSDPIKISSLTKK